MPLNRPLGSMLAPGLKEWKERAFSQHPPSPRVWSKAPNVELPMLGQHRALPPPRPVRLQRDPSLLIGKLSHQSCQLDCAQEAMSVSQLGKWDPARMCRPGL